MSETATTETPTEPTTEESKQAEKPAEEPLGEGGKKALDAERQRAKDLEKQLNAATAKLTEIERANETALEKAQREAQEAQGEAAKATLSAFREAAVKFGGIDPDDASLFLTANDLDTLQKQAARLAERTPTGPKPDLTQGGGGEPPALNSDALDQALRNKLGIT